MNLRTGLLLAGAMMQVAIGFSQSLVPTQKDTTSLTHFLKSGTFSVKARSFFMATINDGSLRDYYSLATGAGIGYETPAFKNFQLKFSGFFMTGFSSCDLSKPDSISKAMNRYELSLFDVTDPCKKTQARFEEFYLRYHLHHSTLTVGKQILKTPFINTQDSYMRPTVEEGAWAEIQEIKNVKIQAGWLWKMLPVSVSSWYSVAKSVGLYSQGVDATGHANQYRNNVNSSGIGMIGVLYSKKNISLQFWDVYAENLFNTAYLQSDIKFNLSDKRKLVSGLQLMAQHSSGNGGNSNEETRYYQKNMKGFALSSRLGYEAPKFEAFLNYTRISNDNEFLMPREWGREPFYTFMWREKNEGFGDLNAVVASGSYKLNNRWEFQTAYGHYYLPDIKNFQLNKYGMPSYIQWNNFIIHHFSGKLEGLQVLLLLTYKNSLSSTYNNPKYVDNKVKMVHSSLILDYHF